MFVIFGLGFNYEKFTRECTLEMMLKHKEKLKKIKKYPLQISMGNGVV